MATRSPSLLLLLLLMMIFSSVSISTILAAEADDAAALLAFKASATSGATYSDVLASWNDSTSGYCSWEGVRCRGKRRRVVALNLYSHGLIGTLSPAIGNLSSLRTLNLSRNRLSGDVPPSLGRLRHLHVLDLGHNAFSGELPDNLSSCTNVTVIGIHSNQLHGHIPPEFGNKLTRLRFLVLWGNNLTGSIPETLANLSSLRVLTVAYNKLEGTIPPILGRLVGLRYFDIAFNSLSGKPPISLYNLSNLAVLQIQGNMLQGIIPADIGRNFPNIWFLSMCQNRFTGSIPATVANLSSLQVLDLSTNRLSGYVPTTLGRLQDLQHLYLYVNKLEAHDPKGWEFIAWLSNCSQLLRIVIDRNAGLTGQLPSSIVNLSTTLQTLMLADTGISGTIPSAISQLINLEFFSVANTSTSGMIPETIGKLGNLVQLGLYNTDLSGQIPPSIGNLSKLSDLQAYNSKFEGAIPASFGQLENLALLDLSGNHLNSSVPTEIFKLPLLSNYLDLSYNSLSGTLPLEVGSLKNLNQLKLSGNHLSGKIPESIGKCTVLEQLLLDDNSLEGGIPQSLKNIKGLSVLNLSMNQLSGTIPNSIGSMQNLQELYLAHNNFSGSIPKTLQNLTSLLVLDLSFNNLQGEVPKVGIFKNLTNLSITGNIELCGGIPQLHLAPCQTSLVKKNRRGWTKSIIIALATAGSLLLLAFVIAFVRFYKNVRRKQKSSLQPPIVNEQFERVSYHALANGTNGFSESNLLGTGGFGAVYKCTFEDEGTTVAVKVFKLEQAGTTRSFVTECEALRRVRHRCLIKIITCCSSINHQGEVFKALIFEFMPNGSLNAWLHQEPNMLSQSNTLSLPQRLNIAVDVVDAMDYLHNHCQPPIIHCDLKPSNILLAEDMSARVGDFGISRILPESTIKSLQNSSSTIGIRGSIGYVAPEYGEGSSASTLGDVYSLGILLLEMFTGRSPTDEMFRGSLDLHKFAEDALPNRIWEIVDPTMWMHADMNISATRNTIMERCLGSVIALGISCSNKQPRERVPIQHAAVEMHVIRDSYLKFSRSVVVEHGVVN